MEFHWHRLIFPNLCRERPLIVMIRLSRSGSFNRTLRDPRTVSSTTLTDSSPCPLYLEIGIGGIHFFSTITDKPQGGTGGITLHLADGRSQRISAIRLSGLTDQDREKQGLMPLERERPISVRIPQ